MKKITLMLLILATGFLLSCNSGTSHDNDAAGSADETNVTEDTTGTTPGAVNEVDSKFVTEAANGGMAEVELGKLAQSKGSSDDVKAFAQMMVTDHSKANEELKTIAEDKGITLPAAPAQAQQQVKNDLGQQAGTSFDKAYINVMVEDHKKTVALFEEASKNSKDSELKAFADKTLPTLKMHLEHSQSLQRKMK